MLNSASPDGHSAKTERDTGNSDPASPVLKPEDAVSDGPAAPDASLGEDITALIDDSKAYVQAELAFQKSRASFAGQEAKAGVGFVFGALAFLHLGLIGAVIGLIVALGPVVGAFAATGIVVGVLLVGMALMGWLAVRRFSKIGSAFQDDASPDDAGETP